MNIGVRVHLYWPAAYNQRGRVIAVKGYYLSVQLDSGRVIEGIPACDAEVVP